MLATLARKFSLTSIKIYTLCNAGYDNGSFEIGAIMSFEFDPQNPFACFVTQSPEMKRTVDNAKKFAMFDVPLLIQGETGTGKDLLAKACHWSGLRKDHKFIAVNCAGLPDNDAESEMFGRKVGNSQTIGFFEYADGGSVLLDGVAELSLNLQAKLLRFLTDGSFRRVGEEQEHHANVRVICTMQESPETLLEQGILRLDLFHRLNVLRINIPPLRQRIEDIVPLSEIFLTQISQQLNIPKPTYSAEFIHLLQQQTWPGNVRELYNTLYQACSLSGNAPLDSKVLSISAPEHTTIETGQFEGLSLQAIMDGYEANILRAFYREYPSTRKLAQRLGVSHTAIANKLKQYGISK